LIVLGDGGGGRKSLEKIESEGGSGWIVITAGWAFAVMAGVGFVSIACGISDAHLNSRGYHANGRESWQLLCEVPP